MGRSDIRGWAFRFARDLGEGSTRILFERMLSKHLDQIAAIRQDGLSWPSIASILTQAGVRRIDGRSISADHLRAAYSRLCAKKRRVPGRGHRDTLTMNGPADSLQARSQSPAKSDGPVSCRVGPKNADFAARAGPPLHSDLTSNQSSPSPPEGRRRAPRLRAAMHRAQRLRAGSSD